MLLTKNQINEAVKYVAGFVADEHKVAFSSALKSRLTANKDTILFGMYLIPQEGELIYEALKKAGLPLDTVKVAELKVGFFDSSISLWSQDVGEKPQA